MYGFFIVSSGLSTSLGELLIGLHLGPVGIVAVILVVYLILGFFIDSPLVLLISIPIILPILKAAGIDLIWFGVLAALLTNLGMITPPFGFVLFLLKGVQKGASMKDIYRGVLPFVLASLAVAVLILFYSPLATWLPNLIK